MFFLSITINESVITHHCVGETERLVVHPGEVQVHEFAEGRQGIGFWAALLGQGGNFMVDTLKFGKPGFAGGFIRLGEFVTQPLVARDRAVRSPLGEDEVGPVDEFVLRVILCVCPGTSLLQG